MPDLQALGWRDSFEEAFAAHQAEGLIPARVSLEHNHVYRVLGQDGESLARVAGRIKYLATGRHELPAVGDWVALRADPRHGQGTIEAILPRRTWFSRKAAGRETEEQVIAANVDIVLLVFGLDQRVKPRAIERYLALARRSRVRPVVVLNKADLVSDLDARVARATHVAGDAPVLPTVAATGEGLEALRSSLEPGITMAALGPSGAGKSSIINALMGATPLPTGAVRERDSRGRHTSVHRQMLLRPEGGVFIDTPGMRELQLWEADEGLSETFEEILALAPSCRFRDCRHDREPGCAVKAAVEEGSVEADRYESFLNLTRELAEQGRLRDEKAQLDVKRQARIQGKALKAMQKSRGR